MRLAAQRVLDPPRHEARLAERLERLVFGVEADLAQCEKYFCGGGFAPEPLIDRPGGKISGLRGDCFVVVGLDVVAGALQLNAVPVVRTTCQVSSRVTGSVFDAQPRDAEGGAAASPARD